MPRPVNAALISEMLRAHGAALELFAAQWTAEAEDSVQEAMVELAGQSKAPDNPRAWLYRVVRNRAMNQARAARRRAAHEGLAARLRPIGDDVVDTAEIADALASLADDEREVVVMRVWGQLTWQEIAEVIGKSSSSAERRFQAGLEALKKIWEIATCPTNTNSPTS